MLWSSSNYFLQNINYTTCCLGRYLYRFFIFNMCNANCSDVLVNHILFFSSLLRHEILLRHSEFFPPILKFSILSCNSLLFMKFSYSSCYYSFHYVILPIIMECSFSYCNSSFHISSPFNPVTFPSNFPWTYVFLPGLLSSSLDFSHPPGLVSSSLD